jgi:hypothetical protein
MDRDGGFPDHETVIDAVKRQLGDPPAIDKIEHPS